jgi:hypothetical protein
MELVFRATRCIRKIKTIISQCRRYIVLQSKYRNKHSSWWESVCIWCYIKSKTKRVNFDQWHIIRVEHMGFVTIFFIPRLTPLKITRWPLFVIIFTYLQLSSNASQNLQYSNSASILFTWCQYRAKFLRAIWLVIDFDGQDCKECIDCLIGRHEHDEGSNSSEWKWP